MNIKISVITVSYNSADTIDDTIASVVNQTYQNIEHLVVDGKSSDETVQVVELHKHSKLVITSEPDSGIYDAMNKGLHRAKGEVIGFLNSDDYYADHTALEKVAAVFQDESVEACFADLLYVSRDNSHLVRYWKSNPFFSGAFAKGWSPPHPTFYVRKSAINRLGGFDLSFKLAADAEFMMRYLECGKVKSVYIPHILVRMRIGGVTNQSFKNVCVQNKEILLALKKNKLQFSVFSFGAHKIFSRARQYFYGRLFSANNLPQTK